MADADTRSLQQIKRETEQTRAGLTNTVEQLKTSVAETASDIRHRISPDAIKAEVSDYIRSRGEQLVNDVTSAARRNPMQAVAVGASIAYPLLRIARSYTISRADGGRWTIFCRLQNRASRHAESVRHGSGPFGRNGSTRTRLERPGAGYCFVREELCVRSV